MADDDVVTVSRRDLETLVRAADALALEATEYGIGAETLDQCGIAVHRDATDMDRDMAADDDLQSVTVLSNEVVAAVVRVAPLVGYEPEVILDEDHAPALADA